MEGTNGFYPLEEARKEVKEWLEREATNWCSCNLGQEEYDFHIPPNKYCSICKGQIDNDHYHCGACLRLTQIG